MKPPFGLRKQELLSLLDGVRKSKDVPAPIHKTTQMYDHLIPKHMKDMDWQDHLAKYGWAVVPVPDCDPEYYLNKFYEWLEGCSPVSVKTIREEKPNYTTRSEPKFRSNDPTTWLHKNMPENLHGIFKQYLAHQPWQWELREQCYPIFREIYGTKKLLCSFDGGCFLKPLSKSSTEPAVNGYKQWLHLDQDRLSQLTDGHDPNKMSCVQGLVNLLDCGPADGGLVLVEKSHTQFAGYFERHPADGYGWFRVDMSDSELSKLKVIKVCAPAGSLVLWDSRMVHANCPPTSNQPRVCLYVSMQPRKYANEKELKKRIKLFESGRQTGHWCAGHLLKETAKHPNSHGNPIVMPEEPFCVPELSSLSKKLVGY